MQQHRQRRSSAAVAFDASLVPPLSSARRISAISGAFSQPGPSAFANSSDTRRRLADAARAATALLSPLVSLLGRGLTPRLPPPLSERCASSSGVKRCAASTSARASGSSAPVACCTTALAREGSRALTRPLRACALSEEGLPSRMARRRSRWPVESISFLSREGERPARGRSAASTASAGMQRHRQRLSSSGAALQRPLIQARQPRSRAAPASDPGIECTSAARVASLARFSALSALRSAASERSRAVSASAARSAATFSARAAPSLAASSRLASASAATCSAWRASDDASAWMSPPPRRPLMSCSSSPLRLRLMSCSLSFCCGGLPASASPRRGGPGTSRAAVAAGAPAAVPPLLSRMWLVSYGVHMPVRLPQVGRPPLNACVCAAPQFPPRYEWNEPSRPRVALMTDSTRREVRRRPAKKGASCLLFGPGPARIVRDHDLGLC